MLITLVPPWYMCRLLKWWSGCGQQMRMRMKTMRTMASRRPSASFVIISCYAAVAKLVESCLGLEACPDSRGIEGIWMQSLSCTLGNVARQ
jgi:hypothetical protein